jgi:proline racemase
MSLVDYHVPEVKANSAAIFDCIDAHTCGNPVRLVQRGGPVLQGKNMSEKRQHFLRTLIGYAQD